MTKRMISLALCLLLLLSGCIYRSGGEETAVLTVYRIEQSRSGRRLVREQVSHTAGEDPLELVASALGEGGGQSAVMSALPDGVFVERVSLEAGTATVHMSPAYADMEMQEELLAESAIVLSFSALDEVCTVDIFCNGMPAAKGLTAETISEADGLCGGYERSVKLYLPDETGRSLVPESVSVYEDGSMCSARRVMTELMKALGMESTSINSLDHDEGVCSIDFSHEFYGAEPTESYTGMLMIYSIVNSLCRIPGVEAVRLSVDGYDVGSYGGFRTQWPLSENLNFISY